MRNFEDKQPVEQAIHVRQREWGWIGYTLKRPHRYIAKRVIEWNPQEKCKRSRPKHTWKCTRIAELERDSSSVRK